MLCYQHLEAYAFVRPASIQEGMGDTIHRTILYANLNLAYNEETITS
jgi:hypothetical protein